MAIQVQLRRGTNSQWTDSNPVLADGEIALSTDTNTIKVGNGSSAWSALTAVQLIASGFLSYTGLSSDVEILVGSGPGDLDPLPGSVGSSKTVVQAASGASLGVQRSALSTGSLSDVNTSGAASGDLLQYNGSSWVPLTLGEIALASQRTFQNVALRHAGYFSRGQFTTTVYKWAFPADTVSTTTAAPAEMDIHTGFANPAVAGYSSRLGGSFSLQTVYKWAFPADTVSTTTAIPDNSSGYNAGFANPAVAGYFSRGGCSSPTTTVYKWAFPADTTSTTTAAPDIMQRHAGFANPSVAGYFSRGLNTATIYKWTFPADTVSTTTAIPGSLNSLTNAGFADPAVAGYFSRGVATTTVYKWSFPADTVTTITAAPATMNQHAGFANPAVAGYFSRGQATTTVYKWSFPADTVSTTTAALDTMNSHAGFANA
jgi:hypothetical protein